MSENKRPDTQGWDTEAVRRRIISEVDAGAETGSKKKKHRKQISGVSVLQYQIPP